MPLNNISENLKRAEMGTKFLSMLHDTEAYFIKRDYIF
jgi:hypothetical protein